MGANCMTCGFRGKEPSMLMRPIGVLSFAAMLLVLRMPMAMALDREVDAAQSAVDKQLTRAILAADRVAPAEGANKFHFSLEGMWLYGPVSGHMQTPSGGQPGTTSSKRPTLSEMGIDTASGFD